jgi:hypothetical protein
VNQIKIICLVNLLLGYTIPLKGVKSPSIFFIFMKTHLEHKFESRQTTLYSRVLKIYINAKKTFKKIAKLSGIILLTVLYSQAKD